VNRRFGEKGIVRPQEAIGYWLASALRGLGRAFTEVLDAHCRGRGKAYTITPAQYGVLSLLDHDGEQTIGGIAEALRVDLPTVTGIVTRLERIGLLARSHDRVDRRLVLVALTAEGQDLAISLRGIAAAFNEDVLRGFSPDERRALIEQLQRIIANVSPSDRVARRIP
jgi:DNA-binding MarR family transcriptional regulator